MQIAKGLTSLRNRAGATQGEIAKICGISDATVSRYEDWTAQSGIRWQVVRDIADACQAAPEEREELVNLAKDVKSKDGWWLLNGAVPSWLNPLLALEHEAGHEYSFANAFVPGLLQTRDYALAISREQEVRETDQHVEALADARMQRQTILDRDPPLHLWVVLDEAVLRRVVGSAEVMVAQINHLYEMGRRPNIDIQVLPFAVGAHAAGIGHFVLLGSGEALQVAYVETLVGGLYLHKDPQVQRYSVAWDYLRSQALSSAESRKFMHVVRKEHQ